MSIPYWFIELWSKSQWWSVSWMKGRKWNYTSPDSKPKKLQKLPKAVIYLREAEGTFTSESHVLFYYLTRTLNVSLPVYSDSSWLWWLCRRVKDEGWRWTTWAGQKSTQRTYTSTWKSEPPESTEAADHSPGASEQRWCAQQTAPEASGTSDTFQTATDGMH